MVDATTFTRSDGEVLNMTPIKVTFGKKEYEIAPLTIGKATRWRQKLIEEVGEIGRTFKQDVEGSQERFLHGLAFTFLKFPEKILGLVRAYAPDLPWDKEILDEEKGATEEQLARAFGQVVLIAFPFTSELAQMNRVMALASVYQP